MLELMVIYGPAFETLPEHGYLKIILGESLVITRDAV